MLLIFILWYYKNKIQIEGKKNSIKFWFDMINIFYAILFALIKITMWYTFTPSLYFFFFLEFLVSLYFSLLIFLFCSYISFFFLSFFLFFFLLYNIVLVLPYIDINLPQVYMCSPSWTPLPTSFPIPSIWVIPVQQPQASSITLLKLILMHI